MLTLVADSGSRDCQGIDRRDFLRVGALGLGGLTLPGLLATRQGAAATESPVRDRSVVLLFLGGGPSHIETFDPRMDAPSGIRGATGEVPTSVPGVTFGGTFPRLARLAHRMAVVRSFRHRVGSHGEAIQYVLTGGNPTRASMGSIFARLRGLNHPVTGLPTYACITAPEVDGQYLKEKKRVLVGSGPGDLGAVYGPFDPAGGGALQRDMTVHLPRQRMDDRRTLLGALDRIHRHLDASGTMEGLDRFEQQAYDLLLGSAKDAFDLSREDPRLLERYDTGRFEVGHKKFRRSVLGRQLLLARRLCEAGCGFVTIQSAGWDMHGDGNNPGIVKGMEMLGRPLDQAVSVFLEDVEERGLSEKILLVITGDFGRTPKINKRGGRDHWSSLSTLAFAGGGLKMGQVVGQSDRTASRPRSEPVTIESLMATILHVLFDVSILRVQRGVPAQILALLERGEPIPELI